MRNRELAFNAPPDHFWNAEEKRRGSFILIGTERDETAIRAGFEYGLES